MSAPVIVPRKDWGAENPQSEKKYEKKDLPVPIVYFTLKSGYPNCETKEDCIKAMAEAQKKAIHTDKLSDIPYNFVIASDGTVYEGRGWEAKPDKAIKMEPVDFDPRAFDLAFFGDYSAENVEVPSKPFKAAMDLLDEGVKKKFVEEQYDLEPFRADKFEPEEYPGEEKFKNIQPYQGNSKEPVDSEPYKGKTRFKQ